ncbi:hydroxyacylglutathione hydrolase [Enterobacter wuhouensis]|uniref:hydroxyacylglutathione hydrolase n=1 Tax=Enterobacter wuhouensis TaxID=2529381 RepID=UPI002FCF8428
MALEVLCIHALKDNYIWLIHDSASGETVVIDPTVALPALDAAGVRGWKIDQIWNTHWHDDHTNGNAEIIARTGCQLIGPRREISKIKGIDVAVGEGDQINIGSYVAEVWDVPGHTAGHIAFYIPDAGIIFSGDTLFTMGCGRLLEGTANQMFLNMSRFASLPPDTLVYSGHEYTVSNAKFAISVEPNNYFIKERFEEAKMNVLLGRENVPTSISQELKTNPFMRIKSASELAHLRNLKDNFQS